MDTKRLIVFIALSFGLLFVWQEYFAPKPAPKPAVVTTHTASGVTTTSGAPAATADASANLARGQSVEVTTDMVRARIDTAGGDVRSLDLLQQGSVDDPSKPLTLLTDQGGRTYVAQSGLLSPVVGLPTHKTVFSVEKTQYTLADGQNSVSVTLVAPPENGV
ncbi:MAG: membrane protein insertase YidC, partial [Microvirgula sp.]